MYMTYINFLIMYQKLIEMLNPAGVPQYEFRHLEKKPLHTKKETEVS